METAESLLRWAAFMMGCRTEGQTSSRPGLVNSFILLTNISQTPTVCHARYLALRTEGRRHLQLTPLCISDNGRYRHHPSIFKNNFLMFSLPNAPDPSVYIRCNYLVET